MRIGEKMVGRDVVFINTSEIRKGFMGKERVTAQRQRSGKQGQQGDQTSTSPKHLYMLRGVE